jgi:hypothetical protein
MTKSSLVLATIVLVFVGLLFGPTLLLIAVNFDVYGAKDGRVIDADSGKGISGARVISVATANSRNAVHGGSYETLFRVVETTDVNGNYSIPSQWSHVTIWFPPIPGTGPDVRWTLTVLYPGYVTVGDENTWEKFDRFGNPVYLARSVEHPPAVSELGAHINDILLKKANLTLKQTALYYRQILVRGLRLEFMKDPEEINLRKMAMHSLSDFVCTADPNSVLGYATMEGVVSFVSDVAKFAAISEKWKPTPWPAEMYQYPMYPAADLCSALKQTGNSQ